jgi:phosphoenolpyruvate synthase/pyruvate phosphate dikinase
MSSYILDLREIDQTMLALVGGKATGLGELAGLEGIRVPEGFCLSTDAYKKITGRHVAFNSLVGQLSMLKANDRKNISVLSAKVRQLIEETPVPEEIETEIVQRLEQAGEQSAYAVRSSATAEDLPSASFAGQQDTYLNIIGKEQVLQHIRKCWASLFSDRAVTYRLQNGFGHHKVALSVVVQKMIFPDAAGILFTADPVNANRKIISIDAGFGLGEAMVSGLVNADHYKVRNGEITERTISRKKTAIGALKGGGTKKQEVEPEKQNSPVLTDEQILELEGIGRRIEKHFGSPQDIEWCLADDVFYIVQSRPITTLYPIPEATDDGNRVYISVGHQQMMTDAMKPLGLSFYLLMTPATMRTAGGRLFVDVTTMLGSKAGRNTAVNVLGKFDSLMRDAFTSIIERDFIKLLPVDENNTAPAQHKFSPTTSYQTLKDYDPTVVSNLIRSNQTAVQVLQQSIQHKSGAELFDFILEDIQQLKTMISDPQSMGVIFTGMNAASWINEKMSDWLGEKNAADTLSQSIPNNITSEMGLALLDVADVIRPHAKVVEYLQDAKKEGFLDGLSAFDGGKQSAEAIMDFLSKYGMRCAGEIDITKTRWSEKPFTLVPVILSNIKNFEQGESRRKFEQGLQEALNKEHDLLKRLRSLPGGEEKARETKRMIDLVRNLAGYREYPKYGIVSRYLIYKQALLKEAEILLQAGMIHEKEDVYYLSFEEFSEAVRSHHLDYGIIHRRKEDFSSYEKLHPPRMITSDGEIINGRYHRDDLPAGAIAGLAVSSGTIEGRARVILNMEEADIEEGDILVTAFTDPSWTPLFVSIKGLVTEVGGLMTHGAVIAREYGLPAVVGVEHATGLIRDGQRIRVNGTEGYVEILP